MAKVKQLMTINRSGQFHIHTYGENHCGTTDQFDVRYHINADCSPQLDSRGFKFDQLNIQSFFDSIGKTELSCELLTQACLQQLLAHILKENEGCEVYHMQVSLSPAPYSASMVADWSCADPLPMPEHPPSLQHLTKDVPKVHDPAHKHTPSHTHYKYQE